MSKKLVFLILISGVFLSLDLQSQVKAPFTGDPQKYKEELLAFMGPNLNDEQKANFNNFLAAWDSAAFDRENMIRIIDLSSQFVERAMRPVPYFNDFFSTINTFSPSDGDKDILTKWLTGLSELAFNPRFNNESVDRYIKYTALMVKDNILAETPALKWKVKNAELEYVHDTLFMVIIRDATLTCYSQRDSTEIYNASGIYLPDIQQFHGSAGKITWEKAGYGKDEVYALIDDYIINTSKNNFTIDSARLFHSVYFKTPVYGVLSDNASSISNKERATSPKFTTYTTEFKLENIYKGVNYQGGLAIEGAATKGTGTKRIPARITLFRNDTLYLKIDAQEFLFTKTGLASGETAMTLYLDKDSIYHSNLAFSYMESSRQVNLFRANNPVSKSPYFNSYHKLDMSFELLSWNMDESKIKLSRARGASMGRAEFESNSFFDINYYTKLAGIDDYHPLFRLKKFADWYYSETFSVEAFAEWLNKPIESVIGMCIDMANRGFVFYDRKFNEVTLKKKVDDFLTAFAKKKDYDVLYFTSETKTPLDNASLDLKNFQLTVEGVSAIFLSDSQRVAIYPYNNRVIVGKNRSLEFDGVVEAGLFTVFGHKFAFSYDTFKIRLQKIDSIRIAVETNGRDQYGNPLVKDVDNLIQLGTAELYIDDPNNKSGLRSFKQYPVINAVTYSYIFFDKIPGLENVYPQGDYYFKVDPFTYNNIDHYTNEDMNLSGEFVAGGILKPMHQFLTIQEDNSLGFNMVIPDDGVEVYGSKGRLYDNLSMSSKGLVGSGKLNHLTSTTMSDEYRFFPDSMITQAKTFDIEKDGAGLFPSMNSDNVKVKWDTKKDEWLASNAKGKNFSMFENGTVLDGSLTLTPASLNGSGVVNTTDSQITSDGFQFTTNSIRADSSVYNLKSPSTSGYAFIAENVNTDVNFDQKMTRFRLNDGTSVVKFPEIQYICTMTDFAYNMDTRILDMEQKGKSEQELLSPDKLLKLGFENLDKPTFFATNVIGDTVAFSSWKGSYHLNEEYIEAENINYIHIADALIQPEKGKIIINRRAKIKQMQDAFIAVNNKHILHSAKVDIESTKRYSGSAVYDYIDENKEIQQINFPEIMVDTAKTSAKGYIPVGQKFMLSPAFSFSGDVNLYSAKDFLSFTGSAGINHDCGTMKSYPVKFKAFIDPKNIFIPIAEKPRDINDNMVFSGSYINVDSIHIYPAFLSAQKSWTDVALVNSKGSLYYDKPKGRYIIASLEKIADPTLHGNMVALDKSFCILSSEGKLNFGANYELVNMSSSGKVIHAIDSGNIDIQSILAFDFWFSEEALKIISDELRMLPSLKPVNLNSEFYVKGMKDLMGPEAAIQIKEELDLYGISRNLPKEFNFEILLNDVNLYWNEATSSFRSKGKIGIGFIGTQPVNTYVDGFIEIQRRRSGDMFDIYLKADDATWYYFSYIRGNMMTQAGNIAYNTLIANTKQNLRKHPDSSVRIPYTYMISVEDRLSKFLLRMTEPPPSGEELPDLNGITQ